MTWTKVLQICVVGIVFMFGYYVLSPKYTFDSEGRVRKNVYTGKVERWHGKWIALEDNIKTSGELGIKP